MRDRSFVLRSQEYSSPNLRRIDLTQGQRWMQREIVRLGISPEGWTNMGFKERHHSHLRPHLIADFRSLPFKDSAAELLLFDPAFEVRKSEGLDHPFNFTNREWRLGLYKISHDRTKFSVWRSAEEMWRGLEAAFKEIERVLEPEGLCIFKWGGPVRIERPLRLRPRGLRIERVYERRSKGGSRTITRFVWLRKDGFGITGR